MDASHRRCVLVVDDNEINRVVIARMIEVIGHVSRLAADGQAGVDAVAAGGIDLVLMDVQMPDMDGLAATRAIRARVGARLPIIGVSAHGLDEDRTLAVAAGMDDYLVKPVTLDDLRSCMGRWLR